jgi:hypothetical protein
MPVDTPRRIVSPAFLVSILTLVIATSGAAFAVGKASVTAADIANNAVLSRHIKNGQIQAADLAKGAAPRTTVSFGAPTTPAYAISQDVDTVVVSLTDTGAGGKVTVSRASRLLVHGSVTVGNSAGASQYSIVKCRAQTNKGSGWTDFGATFSTESVGNSNHDETYTISIVGGAAVSKGTYNVRLVCIDDFQSSGSLPRVRAEGLTVTAVTP